jgi:putative protease
MGDNSLCNPELLSPAGDWQCLRAAVENGADAVYFGLDCGFNARARAVNFRPEELTDIFTFLRHRGVKGYVALNTLVFSGELARVEQIVRDLAEAGADAVLVQDLGLVRLVRAVCADLPIHASTQMTLTSAECILIAEELGIERVVLARELSLDEIRKIRDHTSMPLEVFVHGALCVAYSGQCLTSESLGGRSANRGQCAQACRLPYELVCDGNDVDLGDVKYLLSPQDLAAYSLIAELIDMGVCGFKIEGRLKTPEYVANITRHYRRAIDEACAGRAAHFTQRDVREMELSFSRGFSPGWLEGNNHKRLVPGVSSAKRGVLAGEVLSVRGPRIRVRLVTPIARGDGVVFSGDRAAGSEQGGRVFGVFQKGRPVSGGGATGIAEIEFQRHGGIDLGAVHQGQTFWKTDDPQLTARLRRTFSGPDANCRRPLDVFVHAAAGSHLEITARIENGPAATIRSGEILEPATRHPASTDFFRQQLGRLGNTVYELRELEAKIEGPPMVPLSVLSKLRREMTSQLDRLARQLPARHVAAASVLQQLRAPVEIAVASRSAPPRLHVLCRSLDELLAWLETGGKDPPCGDVYVDFQDIRQYRAAVLAARQAGVPIYLATPRIQKPGEIGIFRSLAKHNPNGILVRNFAGLRFFSEREIPLVADFSLNATNELTARYLIEQGAIRITASYDLNREQLLDLVSAAPPAWLEVVIHQHMPMFHMEHCVFCAVLSPGTNKTNCGRPCDDHQVELRDRMGIEHPLHADVGCRNTLFNAVPQSAAEVVPSLLTAGIANFRIELLRSSHRDIVRIVKLYKQLLSGDVPPIHVWQTLQAANRVGVTRGTLEERRDPMAIL